MLKKLLIVRFYQFMDLLITAEARIHPLDKVLHTVFYKQETEKTKKYNNEKFHENSPKATKPVLHLFEKIL